MTDAITPETVTDTQIDEFFDNGGSFKEEKQIDKPEPEAVDEPEPAADSAPKEEEKKVNLGALHEERSRRKAEADARKKAEDRAEQLERELQKYAKPEVSYDDDPIEAVRRENKQIKDVIIAQANKAIEQEENVKYWAKVAASENAYKADKPDFDEAVKFLADSRIAELKDLGWSDAEAAKVLADEIRWIADKAYADEVNPAERFHNLAKRRGFTSTPNEPVIDKSADEKLETIKKGMAANRNLPPASRSVKQDLTAEALADMNVDALNNLRGQTDFDKAWAKLFG